MVRKGSRVLLLCYELKILPFFRNQEVSLSYLKVLCVKVICQKFVMPPSTKKTARLKLTTLLVNSAISNVSGLISFS